MTNDDVLNLTRLVEAFETDVASIANLLTLARETEKRYIAALHAAIAGADLIAVARAAHSIKGSASNIGSMSVSSAAARIEDRARAGRWDDIATFATELDAAYIELSERIALYAAGVASNERS